MDIIVKNGTVVTATDTFKGDVAIKDGKIRDISSKIDGSAGEVIDASGMLVMPGFIDVHTHFQLPFMGTVSADDFVSGSRACAHGGVTTFIDFAIQGKGKSLFETIEARKKEADGKVCIDYSLHCGVTDPTEETLASIKKVIESGIPSFKLFMTYRKEGFMTDDGCFYAVLEEARDNGGLVGVHAENPFILEYLIDKFIKEGKVTPPWHAKSRPDFVEAEAIKRAIFLTELTKSRLYIFHMSTGWGADIVAEAKGRGISVFAETCPQYLLLTDEKYEGEEGIYYPTSPPLRKKEDNERLWKGVTQGAVQVLATDHCSFTRKQKHMGDEVFTKIPNGLPGVETLVPLAFSEGVMKGRISISQMVEVLATNPAKLFGLYPRKGSLAPGADGDLVIFDPKKEAAISYKNLHMNLDFSPFEGWKVQGWPVATISKGKVLCKDGKFFGKEGMGEFIKRSYADTEWEKLMGKKEMAKV